jgi:hypothetical protein
VESCFYGTAQITSCLSYNSDYYYPYASCEGGRPATTSDANSIGLVNAYNSWIAANVNGGGCPGGFPAVGYDYPTLDDQACVTQGTASITNINSNIVQDVLVEQKFTNDDDKNVTYTFELQTTFTNEQTYTVSQESSFSISDTISFSVSEDGFSFGNSFTITTGVKNSQTYSTSYSTSQQISETPTVNIGPGTCVSASVHGNITQLTGTIVIPSFLNGPIRCDFGGSTCGHFYWVANMEQCEADASIDTTVGVLVSYNTILSECDSGEILYEQVTYLL